MSSFCYVVIKSVLWHWPPRHWPLLEKRPWLCPPDDIALPSFSSWIIWGREKLLHEANNGWGWGIVQLRGTSGFLSLEMKLRTYHSLTIDTGSSPVFFWMRLYKLELINQFGSEKNNKLFKNKVRKLKLKNASTSVGSHCLFWVRLELRYGNRVLELFLLLFGWSPLAGW